MDYPKFIVSIQKEESISIQRMKVNVNFHLVKGCILVTPNKFLDFHPNFVKNWDGWEVFIFPTALNSPDRNILYFEFKLSK